MPLNKKQIRRMVLFVKQLKENRYPNSYNFAEYLKDLDLEKNINANCSPRTVQRDIRALKEDFGAPLQYDYERSGYTLTNPYWEFSSPILSDAEILAMVLGGQLADNILPASGIKTQIKEAVAQQLTTNSNEILETAYLDALMICGHMTVDIDGEIFQTVFDAWRNNEALDIEYANAQGHRSLRRIDPHILAFRDGGWFIKGYCHLKEKIWVFSVHRIISAEPTGKYFEHNKTLNEKTRNEGLFELEKIKNVVLRCDNRIINYARDYQFHPAQKIVPVDDNKFKLHIPSAQNDELVRWIMWQVGQVAVIKPEKLKNKITQYAERIIETNRI